MDTNEIVSRVSKARNECDAEMAVEFAGLGMSPRMAQLVVTLIADGFVRGIRFGWSQRQEVEGKGLSDGELNAKLAHVLEAVELGFQKKERA